VQSSFFTGIPSACGVVILDWRLPGVDGSDVLRVMRADKNLASVPVIVVSADHVTREVVLGAGATEYFEKPVASDALLDAIARHAPGK